MNWTIEEMHNIVWCLAAVGADVEANILTDSALVGTNESTMSGSELGEGRAFLPDSFLFRNVDGWGTII